MWRAQLDRMEGTATEKANNHQAELPSKRLEEERRRALDLEGLLAAERCKFQKIEQNYLHQLDTLEKTIAELSSEKEAAGKGACD